MLSFIKLLLGGDDLTTEDHYDLGMDHSLGIDRPKNPKLGAKHLRAAAKQGHPGAQFSLGVMTMDGEGVPKDDRVAERLFRQSAAQGDTDAQYFLGLLISTGFVVLSHEKGEDLAWFTKAADGGQPMAQMELGRRCAAGDGVPKDVDKSMDWYERAATQGHAPAQQTLGNVYFLQRNHTLATKWYQLAASHGDTLAKAYLTGSPETQFEIGQRFAVGIQIEPDLSMAIAWYELAAKRGYVEAQRILAITHYTNGSQSQAVEWFIRAAEGGDAVAQAFAGGFYLYGREVAKDYQTAGKWSRLAADKGEAKAQRHMGKIYAEGLGVDKDLAEAKRWYSLAAALGDEAAQDELKCLNA